MFIFEPNYTLMQYQELLDSPAKHLTPEEFFRFCRDNDELRIERDQDGNVEIMPPTGFETGRRNSALITELSIWNRQQNFGIVGDSSTGYTLPNGAVRSPDVSWISNDRLAATTPEDRKRFVSAVPEFAVEIRSQSDRPRSLRDKIQEYLENGVLLAWLIDVPEERVEIYRSNGEMTAVEGFEQMLPGENVLPGFEFDLNWMK